MPRVDKIAALIAFARRCPDCPPITAEDLAPTPAGRMRMVGRPRGPARVPRSVRILAATDARLTAAVEATGDSPQYIVDEALAAYLDALGIPAA